MKQSVWVLAFSILLAGSYSCKGKNDKNIPSTNTSTTNTAEPATAPVVVSGDEELRRGVADATKDYAGVNASVANGVITLTGSIEKDRYLNLKQSFDALRPKQVVNNLNYK